MKTLLILRLKKVIVFDLDGTIVELTADWHGLIEFLRKRYSERYNEECNCKRVSSYLTKIIEKKDEEELRKSFEIIRKYELENIKQTIPIDEIIYFINNLGFFGIRKDTKLAILSLNTHKTIIESLKLINLEQKIDYIVGREDVRKWKPHPEGLMKIKNFFGVSKEEVVFIGDLDNDLLTGQNMGIDSFLVDDLIKLVKESKMK
ncbi:MAG: HAD family hydrolase [Promethearchaeota archaeon]